MTLPTPEALRKGHVVLTSTEPTERQLALYNQFPTFRGPNGSHFDVELFEATVIMGLTQSVSSNVYLFVPSVMEKEAIEALRTLVQRIFVGIKERKAIKQAKAVGKAVKALMIGHKFLQLDAAPDHWVAFGFSKHDLVPDWLKDALYDVQSCAQNQ